MSKNDIQTILKQEIDQSLSYMGGELAHSRKKAMEYYLSKPFGNEVEGRSQVVSSDVADTIEWILPSLLKIFTSSDKVVRFDPVGAEDEAVADQATDYVNHIFQKDNPGFVILYTWFKDALLQKNGFVKYYWQKKKDISKETFKALSEDAYALLLAEVEANSDLKIKSRKANKIKEKEDESNSKDKESKNISATYDVVVERHIEKSRICVKNVSPEEFLIHPDAKTIDDAAFVAHRLERSISDLIASGYDRKTVEALSDDDGLHFNEERQARRLFDDTPLHERSDNTRKVPVYECYIRLDEDGDGIAELRKVTVAGAELEVLDNEEVDFIPFASLSPVLIPHQFYGLSIADLVMDLQLIKSTVMRQVIDNMYLTNNNRHVVVDGQVNLDDLMTSRPGGVVRVKNPAAIQALNAQSMPEKAFGLLQYIDGVREERTGVTKNMQGMDTNTLNKTASGINQIMTAAQQRIELIARVFAETGVKDLFSNLLKLVVKYQDQPRMIRLRNEWVPMDGSQFDPDMDVSVSVGLGTGNKDQSLAHLQNILNIQKEAISVQGGVFGPLVTLDNIHNTLAKMVENAGLKNVAEFFQKPNMEQLMAQENQKGTAPNPQAQAMLEQLRLASEKIRIDGMKAETDRLKAETDAAIKEREIRLKEEAARQKTEEASDV